MAALTLEKYEGLGNDFLVLVDPPRRARYDAAFVRAICDRHRGIGADGVIRLSSPKAGGHVAMDLRNADGSIAETSGNGLRCAAIAAHAARVAPSEMTIETIVGTSRAAILDDGSATGTATVRVAMGRATVERRPEFDSDGRRAFGVEIGNPHLVLIGGADLDVRRVGPPLEVAVAGGQNVELVQVVGEDALAIATWERGAGATLACGSGSCAAAAAARSVGAVGDEVRVDNPGGAVVVALHGAPRSPDAELTGAARRVGTVVLDEHDLRSLEMGVERA